MTPLTFWLSHNNNYKLKRRSSLRKLWWGAHYVEEALMLCRQQNKGSAQVELKLIQICSSCDELLPWSKAVCRTAGDVWLKRVFAGLWCWKMEFSTESGVEAVFFIKCTKMFFLDLDICSTSEWNTKRELCSDQRRLQRFRVCSKWKLLDADALCGWRADA